MRIIGEHHDLEKESWWHWGRVYSRESMGITSVENGVWPNDPKFDPRIMGKVTLSLCDDSSPTVTVLLSPEEARNLASSLIGRADDAEETEARSG